MRALLHDFDWQPEFLQQAWRKFHIAMTRASVAGQLQRVACYVVTLGYSREDLGVPWACFTPRVYCDGASETRDGEP